jgi:hypothetical protein
VPFSPSCSSLYSTLPPARVRKVQPFVVFLSLMSVSDVLPVTRPHGNSNTTIWSDRPETARSSSRSPPVEPE